MVDEIILYYDAPSKKHQIHLLVFVVVSVRVLNVIRYISVTFQYICIIDFILIQKEKRKKPGNFLRKSGSSEWKSTDSLLEVSKLVHLSVNFCLPDLSVVTSLVV